MTGAPDWRDNGSDHGDIIDIEPPAGIAGLGLTAPQSVVKLVDPERRERANDAKCTPITKMASDFKKASSGRLIAVNDNYICYSIKENQIRVIHFVQVTRNRLAAHDAQVVDIEFASRDLDMLASLDIGGTLRVRKIFEENDACKYTNEVEIHFPVARAATRVCWGPSNTLAVACDNVVVVVSCTEVMKMSQVLSPGSFAECGSCAHGHTGIVQDVSFSPDFKYLLTASDDGTVRLWETKETDKKLFARMNSSMDCVHSFSPNGGAPINTAAFVAVPFLGSSDKWSVVTGSSENSNIRLWQMTSQNSGETWPMAHEIILRNEASSWTNVIVDDSSRFLLLANTMHPYCQVLHIADDASSFDLLTEWKVEHPILSFVADAARADGENTPAQEDYEIRCFCIQTKTISKYTLQPADCLPKITRGKSSNG